jgi:hypothetical protein
LSGLEINPLLITGYSSADEMLVVRILEQLMTSVDTPLSLNGHQFMRRFSTPCQVDEDAEQLMSMEC